MNIQDQHAVIDAYIYPCDEDENEICQIIIDFITCECLPFDIVERLSDDTFFDECHELIPDRHMKLELTFSWWEFCDGSGGEWYIEKCNVLESKTTEEAMAEDEPCKN